VGPRLYLLDMMTALQEQLEDAWARALPGREAAERKEALRTFYATLIAALSEKGRHRPD
jgi:hypothetical protein